MVGMKWLNKMCYFFKYLNKIYEGNTKIDIFKEFFLVPVPQNL